MTRRPIDPSVATRWLIVVLVVVVIFVLRWDFDTAQPDFQAWRAADALARVGADPYDADVLNTELSSSSTYGPIWQGEDAERYRMHFFNPPTWLLELRLFGVSALFMSAVGATLLFGSIVLLDRDRPFEEFLAHVLACALLLLSKIGVSTLQFGQTGLLLAGLVGMRLVLVQSGARSRRASGVPIAMLSFKPHIALAAALPQLLARPRDALRQITIPAALVLVSTVLAVGISPFGRWLQALLNAEALPPFDDMTLRTLSPRWPLPDQMNVLFLVLAVGIVVVTCRRWARADPALLLLWSIALTITLSGHGFEHDWLWLALLPVVRAWKPVPTLVVTASAIVVHAAGFTTSPSNPPVVSTTSLVAIAATAYLAWAAHRSARGSSSGAAAADQRATAIA